MNEAIVFRADPRRWWQRWRHENASLIEDWRRALYRFRQSTLSMPGWRSSCFSSWSR